MLKIKDNVDLKELEKYGWFDNHARWLEDSWLKNEYYPEYTSGKFTILKNKHIRSRAGDPYEGLDALFDIIQAGLVEKIENETKKI